MWKNTAHYTPRRCTPCRVCAACACILILLAAIVALLIYLLVKPPQVDYVGVVPGSAESSVNGLQLNATSKLIFRVHNQNPVGITFNRIEAAGYIPGSQTPVAFGHLDTVSISSNAVTAIQFPLTVSYNPSNDKDFVIARYLVDRCTNGNQMTVAVTVKLYIVPLSTFGIVPTVDKSPVVSCPDVSNLGESIITKRSLPENILANLPPFIGKLLT